MVRYICITHGRDFQIPQHRIISLNEFVDGESGIDKKTNVAMFNDMTTNFMDLGYWDSEKDLNGKNVREVETKIQEILRDLKTNGFTMRTLTEEDEESITIPSWMWGHKDKRSGIISENLPDSQRISILMFHLNNLLKTSQEYSDEYYFFLDPY